MESVWQPLNLTQKLDVSFVKFVDNYLQKNISITKVKENHMAEKIVRSDGKSYSLKDNKNRFLFPQEYKDLVENLLTKKQKNSVHFLMNTGARINEARHVKVSDVDFKHKRLVFRVTKSKAKKGEEKGKGKVRIVPISTQFKNYLRDYAIEKNFMTQKNAIVLDGDFNILSTSALNNGLKDAAQKAGLKNPDDFSAHSLRKTFEVWLMALGCVTDLGLTAHLGHDIKTAASSYVSPDVFTFKEKEMIRGLVGDLYSDWRRF